MFYFLLFTDEETEGLRDLSEVSQLVNKGVEI